MITFRNRLTRFLNEPNETNFRNYRENALVEIEALSDLLGSAIGAGDTSDDTPQYATWMLNERAQDLQKVIDIWEDTKRFNELNSSGELMLMAEDEETGETLYSGKVQREQPSTLWFLSHGKFSEQIFQDDAKEWYERNNLVETSPFHKDECAA